MQVTGQPPIHVPDSCWPALMQTEWQRNSGSTNTICSFCVSCCDAIRLLIQFPAYSLDFQQVTSLWVTAVIGNVSISLWSHSSYWQEILSIIAVKRKAYLWTQILMVSSHNSRGFLRHKKDISIHHYKVLTIVDTEIGGKWNCSIMIKK